MLLLQNGKSGKLLVATACLLVLPPCKLHTQSVTSNEYVAGSDDHDSHLLGHHLWNECSCIGWWLPQIHVLPNRHPTKWFQVQDLVCSHVPHAAHPQAIRLSMAVYVCVDMLFHTRYLLPASRDL